MLNKLFFILQRIYANATDGPEIQPAPLDSPTGRSNTSKGEELKDTGDIETDSSDENEKNLSEVPNPEVV